MQPEASDLFYLTGNMLSVEVNREFDSIAIDEFFTRVETLTKSLDQWLFYQKVGPDMGISTNGLESLYRHYRQLQKVGCCGIAVESDNMYVHIGVDRWPDDLDLPVKVASTKHELQDFIQEHLPA